MLSQLFRICVACISLALGACSSADPAEHGHCDPADAVITPGGPQPRECVHEVPSGASVATDPAGNTIVTLNGKVVATYPPCPCADAGAAGAAGVADR